MFLDERWIILNLLEMTDMSSDEIASRAAVNLVRGSVHNVINNPTNIRESPRSSRPLKITDHAERFLLKKAQTRN